MNDAADRKEQRKAIRDRIEAFRQQQREQDEAYRKAIQDQIEAIKQMQREKQEAQKKAVDEHIRAIKQLQREERIECKKTLREQFVEKMEQAREGHIKKHHVKELEFLQDRGDTEDRKGFLKLHILGVLAEGPSHGYEIMHRICQHTGHMWQPSPGSMYPALEMLELKGYITCRGDGRRKVYSLTSKGQNILEQIRKKHEEQFYEMKAFMSALFDE